MSKIVKKCVKKMSKGKWFFSFYKNQKSFFLSTLFDSSKNTLSNLKKKEQKVAKVAKRKKEEYLFEQSIPNIKGPASKTCFGGTVCVCARVWRERERERERQTFLPIPITFLSPYIFLSHTHRERERERERETVRERLWERDHKPQKSEQFNANLTSSSCHCDKSWFICVFLAHCFILVF